MSGFVRQEIILHCMEQLPFEACGLLSGKNGKALTVWKIKNVKRSPVSFMMDTEEIRAVFARIEEKEETLVGIYHSHPTAPPYPSIQDIVNSPYPDIAYLIVSFANSTSEIGCYRIWNQQVNPLSVAIIPTPLL